MVRYGVRVATRSTLTMSRRSSGSRPSRGRAPAAISSESRRKVVPAVVSSSSESEWPAAFALVGRPVLEQLGQHWLK
jgi:hypothetical protein